MATLLTNKQKEVIRKIMYAVESGGQVYGKQNYSALIGAGANNSNEVAITIGAGQWYAGNAKVLLDFIRSTNKTEFDKLDTAGISNDLDTQNWAKYSIKTDSDKAKCIVKIISSPIGIKCQDDLMEKQIVAHAEAIQKTYGDMTVDAIAECINVKHQGGDGALKRILSKTSKPYSAEKIKATLDLDVQDKSSNTQVGDYTTRQNKVYNMIVTYLIPTMTITNGGKSTMTEKELRSQVVNWLTQYVGISEGSAKHIEIINTLNNSGLCTRYKMTTKDAWCATGVSAAFIALDLAGKPGSGKLFECCECSCGNMVQLAQQQGIWVENDAYVPEVGDVIMYDWNDSGSGDAKGWPDHVGIVSYVNGNTFKVIEANLNDSVAYRSLTVNAKYIRGYITPKYDKFATGTVVTETPAPTPTAPTTSSSTVSTGSLNKTCRTKGTVTANSGLKVRSWAGTEFNELRALTKGTAVEICDTIKDKSGDDWYYIKESNKYGFVSADYVAVTTAPVPSEEKGDALNKTCKFKGKVTANSGLKVRSWAGTEFNELRVLAKGTTVEVCDEVKASTGKMWYYIKESGKYGFVSAEYVARV